MFKVLSLTVSGGTSRQGLPFTAYNVIAQNQSTRQFTKFTFYDRSVVLMQGKDGSSQEGTFADMSLEPGVLFDVIFGVTNQAEGVVVYV